MQYNNVQITSRYVGIYKTHFTTDVNVYNILGTVFKGTPFISEIIYQLTSFITLGTGIERRHTTRSNAAHCT